ncbi:MAG: hypothetical protein ACRD30_02345 [Bryobacteraceae bacterium]
MANPGPNLTESAERAGRMIRDLQDRLKNKAGGDEAIDNLARELQQYFASAAEPAAAAPNDLRTRVIAGLVDRILREWEQDGAGKIEDEVAERLIQKIFDRFGAERR